MKNLILGTAIGYNWDNIKIFIKSLRRFCGDRVLLLVNPIVCDKLKKKLALYDVGVIECSLTRENFRFRYLFFFEYLKKNYKKYNLILFTDVRDVYFQSNPFKKKYRSSINFYEEDEKIINCKINSTWLLCLGKKKFNLYKNKVIVCGGTILGRSKYMFKYLKLMTIRVPQIKMIFSFKDFFFRRMIKAGLDQPACHDIVYSKIFVNQKIFSNKNGNIATVSRFKNFNFDKNGNLVNSLKKRYDIIHQYDRHKKIFKKILMQYK
jgi:hypothetical protein